MITTRNGVSVRTSRVSPVDLPFATPDGAGAESLTVIVHSHSQQAKFSRRLAQIGWSDLHASERGKYRQETRHNHMMGSITTHMGSFSTPTITGEAV